MESIKQFFKQDRFAEYIGVELVSVSPGHAIARLPLRPHHLNGMGVVQGGATFTLADLAFAAAANSHGTIAVSINVNISYPKAVSSGVLIAEAREVSKNSKLGTYTVEVKDEQGELIAVFQGLAYRKKEAITGGPT